nr:progesterone-induced-blocking factor 1-like [Lytechinus pictus]
MAHKDISSLISELDTDVTGEISTSLATDISFSAGDETDENRQRKSRHSERRQPGKITRQLIERKQLLHDLQLVKIELSQKNLIIDNLKAEQLARVEELEEKLGDASHTKQILQARLEAQLNVNKEEARHLQQKLQADLHTITEKQRHLEATNAELQSRAGDVRRALHNLDLTDEQYSSLKRAREEELTLRDVIAVKFYEEKHPLQLKLTDLEGWKDTLETELKRSREEQFRLHEALEKEQRLKSDAEGKCQRLTLDLANLKSTHNQNDYKQENYDRVKSERDNYEQQLDDLEKQHTYLNVTFKAVAEERDQLVKELGDKKQELLLLDQDKGYFSKQFSDVSNKLAHAEERLLCAQADVDHAKRSREELYEKYIESRDQCKVEYETRLREELESIRLRTETEIDKLKSTMRDTFERENRSLRDARDNAVLEKDRALASDQEGKTKYEELFAKYRELQSTSDARAMELSSEAKLKTFEAERSNMIQEETQRNLKQAQVDCDKLQKKLEVLTKEYYTMQSSGERRATELEAQLSELKSKLETYEKLEKELDEVVMQAAEYDQADEAEKVLFSYGYGANVPSTAKRRLQHSVHLARRVLSLERINTSLKKDIERRETKIQQLGEELSQATGLLDQAQQPYNYLIDSIRSKDQQISKHKDHITSASEDIRKLKEERDTLMREKNQLAADLERLLNQKEQMALMKQVVMKLSQRGNKETPHYHGNKESHHSPVLHERLSRDQHPVSKKMTVGLDAGDLPRPTVFTKSQDSQWYDKLKERNTNRGIRKNTWKEGT